MSELEKVTAVEQEYGEPQDDLFADEQAEEADEEPEAADAPDALEVLCGKVERWYALLDTPEYLRENARGDLSFPQLVLCGESAAHCRRTYRADKNMYRAGQTLQGITQISSCQCTGIELPFHADIEYVALKSYCHCKPCENQGCGLYQDLEQAIALEQRFDQKLVIHRNDIRVPLSQQQQRSCHHGQEETYQENDYLCQRLPAPSVKQLRNYWHDAVSSFPIPII